MTEYRPVEIRRTGADGPTPGLERVAARRVDGPADAGQERTVVLVWDGDDDRREVDIATDRVDDATQPGLVEDILRPKLEGSA